MYDCRFYDWRWNQPPTGPLDYADFRLPNGLHHQVLEPARRYHLAYDQPGLQLDLEWSAVMAPHEIRYSNPSTMTGACHFDQPGRARGSVVLDGERIDAEDDLGRSLHAEGEVRTALRWYGWPGRLTFWTLTRWQWEDGQRWGEDQEFFPREAVRELLRG